MSDVKALPENMEEVKQDSEYKRLYKKHTIDELELQLMEENIDFLSADDKPDLVWRLLDAQGYNLKTGEYADATNQDDANQADSASNDDGHTNGGDANATDSNSGNNNSSDTAESVAPTDKGNSNETMEANETPAQGEGAANSDNDSGQGGGSSDAPADSASESGSKEPGSVADTTVTNAPSGDSNSDDNSANQANEPAKASDKPASDSSASDNKTSTKAPVSEAEFIEVKSKGSFNMLEPATSTLVVAGKTTKIYIKGYATKDQVLRNIAQYNHTRGNKLTVTN